MSRWEALGIAESLSPHHKANDMIRRDGKLDVPLTVEDECLSEGWMHSFHTPRVWERNSRGRAGHLPRRGRQRISGSGVGFELDVGELACTSTKGVLTRMSYSSRAAVCHSDLHPQNLSRYSHCRQHAHLQ